MRLAIVLALCLLCVSTNCANVLGLVGGFSDLDVKDKSVIKLANKGLETIQAKSTTDDVYSLVEVVSAKCQVVAGLNYELVININKDNCPHCNLIQCKVNIFEQSWMHREDIKIQRCQEIDEFKSESLKVLPIRKKKSSLSVTDSNIKRLTDFALEDMNKNSDDPNIKLLIKIENATKQDGGSILYFLDFVVSSSRCQKSSGHYMTTVKECGVKPNSMEKCSATLWLRPWMPDQQVLTSSCSPYETTPDESLVNPAPQPKSSVSKRAEEMEKHVLKHEPQWVDVGEQHVQSAARFAVGEINKASNNMYSHVLLKTTEATTKVVGGLEYNLTIVMADSKCRKTDATLLARLEDCGTTFTNVQWCNAVVWTRVWETDPKARNQLTSFSCTPESHQPCNRKDYEAFKGRFAKLYQQKEEDEYRFKVFCDNMRKAQHMQDLDQGTARYGATKFADLTEKEFKQYVSSPWDLNANDGMKEAAIPNIKVPTNFDWRSKNAVTPIKNQGSCGSCWAFSTTGNIEGQWAIKKGKLISLSEQELVDCDKVDHGCEGGLPSQAYNVIMKLGGLETEKEYPYEGRDDKCHFNKSDAVANLTGSVRISKDEAEMAAWLVKNGPISIGINAFAMQFYWGGVSHPWRIFCNPSHLDHGVLIVGFGVDGSKPFWIVKNSWGPSWGVKGYYLIYRGDGSCGLNQMATSATVA